MSCVTSGSQYSNIFSMLSSVLWPSDKPQDDTDYDFVYPMPLNMSEQGQYKTVDYCSFSLLILIY